MMGTENFSKNPSGFRSIMPKHTLTTLLNLVRFHSETTTIPTPTKATLPQRKTKAEAKKKKAERRREKKIARHIPPPPFKIFPNYKNRPKGETI